ncbi:MAG: ABC transporter ATP-binding protein [Desulfovibrionaceae bacterium]|nr:ABC transporter ATP-binding protein [Desulfovibrionaceae bacterium]MBF0512537.1 ABC transporter ATP-binding protein [Desulfovibrionaceae bacterium]
MHGPIVLTDLTAGYNRHPAVHHVSGRFEPGSLTAVVGPNGSGKSTLLKALVGLLPLMGGKIDLGGLIPRELGYLPQMSEIDRSFPVTVLDMASLGHWNSLGAFGRMTPAHYAAARQALASVGLAGFETRPIGTLSAGQFQRVLFARLLLRDAPVILLDEPFTAVDAKTTDDLLRLILELNRAGRTVAAVIHDLDQARAHFPSALLLAREAIAWGATENTLTPDALEAARCMAEAWDENAPPCPGIHP